MKEKMLRLWIEQGNVSISRLFFQQYRALNISEREAIVLLHLHAYQEEGVSFPTPGDLSKRIGWNPNDISSIIQSLMKRGLLEIVPSSDEDGVLYEAFSLYRLWERLIQLVEEGERVEEEEEAANDEGALYAMFEQEFGRLLSPMESEMIGQWLDDDHHSVEVIQAALREAVIAQKLSLRYIDRILFDWKKKNVRTLDDVKLVTQSFQANRSAGTSHRPEPKRPKPSKHVPLYNWLDD